MDLVYDIYAIGSDLGRDPDLFSEGSDIVHGIVGGGVQLMDAVGTVFVEGEAGFTLVTGLTRIGDVTAIYGLGKDPCTGGFSYSTGTAEQVSMTQMIVYNGIPECGGNGGLTDHIHKTRGPVLPG
jgi:hypothetical protein